MSAAVIGEALIDLVPGAAAGSYTAHPGGSPFNVAIGLARLEVDTSLVARLGTTAFGQILRERAVAESLDLTYSVDAPEPTTLAVVSLDPLAQASYDFYVEGTADWQWTGASLTLPADVDVVHFGSLASWLPPGSSVIISAVREFAGLVTYDPNVRPSLLGSPSDARPRVEAGVRVAQLVKASREDVSWLYPDLSLDEVAARWHRLGALLVVITDGADGAFAFAEADSWRRPGRAVDVVDTVGAGDAFTSGLIAGLLRRDAASPAVLGGAAYDLIAACLDEAILVSALTCQRAGADPPRLSDLRPSG